MGTKNKQFVVSYTYNGVPQNKLVNEEFLRWLASQFEVNHITIHEMEKK